MRTREPVVIGGGGMELLTSNWFSGREFSGPSPGSEHDLAAMVRDFIEIGSAGTESWCSSDGDSGVSELAYLADRILLYVHPADQYETDLRMVVKSTILSITKTNQIEKDSSRTLYTLANLLQSSGYDAAVSVSKWQSSGKVPGGEHKFIDILVQKSNANSQRYIVDIDFRSHFQIARAVEPYDAVLHALPSIFVGTMTKLKQLLRIMVEAARSSLEQNSMPLPPWRSYPYLEAKWQSPCKRIRDLK